MLTQRSAFGVQAPLKQESNTEQVKLCSRRCHAARLALTSQSLLLMSASYATLLAALGLLLTTTWAVTPSISGEDAR